jgi:hypothetical protein
MLADINPSQWVQAYKDFEAVNPWAAKLSLAITGMLFLALVGWVASIWTRGVIVPTIKALRRPKP